MTDLTLYGIFIGGALSGILSGYVSIGLGYPKSMIVHWLGAGMFGVVVGTMVEYLPSSYIIHGLVGGTNAVLAYKYVPSILAKTFMFLGIGRNSNDKKTD